MPVWLTCACALATKTMAVWTFRSAKIANFRGLFFQIVHLFRLGNNGFLLSKFLSIYNYWRSGSPWKSEAENMADFGLCWRHMVPSATGIYHWPTAMRCFWQRPSPPWFLQKKLWLSCFQNKIFMKNSFFSLVDGGTWKNNEKMFLLTGKSCETFKFFIVLPG